MTTPNTNKLLDGTLKIVSTDNFSSAFYQQFSSNINSYFSSRDYSAQIATSIRLVFGSTLNISQSNTLQTTISNITARSYESPIAQTIMSNMSDNSLVNLLTTGNSGSSSPSIAQKTEVSSAATYVYPSLTDNYSSSIGYVRDNQFCCSFVYPNYYGGNQFVLNFANPISDDVIGACVGLIAYVDQNKIDLGDANILVNLINIYSNTASVLVGSVPSLQATANQNFNKFRDTFLNAVNSFINLPSAPTPNRTGAKNVPNGTVVTPGLLDANLEIISSGTINAQGQGPVGVVLNSFSEPNINDVNSILDIIRNNINEPTANYILTDVITVEGNNYYPNPNNGPTSQNTTSASQIFGATPPYVAPTAFTGPSGVVAILQANPQAFNSAVTALQNSIISLQQQLNDLSPQIGGVVDTDEFVLTSIIAAGLSPQYSYPDVQKQPQVLSDCYVKLSNSLQAQPTLYSSSSSNTSSPTTNNSESGGKTSTVQSSIQKANFNTVSNLNIEFRKNLEIYTDFKNGTTISPDVIKQIMNSTKNNPPPEFQTIVSLTNRGDVDKVNAKIQEICNGVLAQIQEISGQQTDLNNQIATNKKILAEMQAAQQ